MNIFRNISNQLTGGRIAALLFIAFMLGYGFESLQLAKTIEVDIVGPDTFPKLLAIVGVILGAILFLQSSPKQKEKNQQIPSLRDRLSNEIFLLFPLALLLIYVLTLETIGFPLGTFILLIIFFKILGQPAWLMTVFIAALMTAVIFGLFSTILEIPLPVGTLFTEQLELFQE